MRYLGINLTKEVKDLYSENYTTLRKEIKEDKNKPLNMNMVYISIYMFPWYMETYTMFMDWKNQHHQNAHITQSNV